MKKIFAILFLALLFIFLESNNTAQASLNSVNTPRIIAIHTEDDDYKQYSSTQSAQYRDNDDEREHEDELDDDDKFGKRKIFAKPFPSGSPTLTPTPIQTVTVTPSETPTPTINPSPVLINNAAQPEINIEANNFGYLKEIEKLLSTLKKIIFEFLG